jgi:hypothetical protein
MRCNRKLLDAATRFFSKYLKMCVPVKETHD